MTHDVHLVIEARQRRIRDAHRTAWVRGVALAVLLGLPLAMMWLPQTDAVPDPGLHLPGPYMTSTMERVYLFLGMFYALAVALGGYLVRQDWRSGDEAERS